MPAVAETHLAQFCQRHKHEIDSLSFDKVYKPPKIFSSSLTLPSFRVLSQLMSQPVGMRYFRWYLQHTNNFRALLFAQAVWNYMEYTHSPSYQK